MSAFDLGSIVGHLALDKGQFTQDLAIVGKDFKKLADEGAALGRSITKIGKTMSVAGLAIVGAFGAMVKKTADAGDAFYDLSQRTGVSTKLLSSYKLAADQAGTSLEGLATGFRGLSARMLDVKNGQAESKRAFDQLGISVVGARGELRPMNDVMLDVADRFAAMEDGATKAALAQDIFGRSGMELIPMLNAGRKGLEEAAERAEKLGLVFDEKAAKASDALNDALTELKGGFVGIFKELTVSLMPTLRGFAERITGVMQHVVSWIREHPALVEGFVKATVAVGGVLAVLGPVNIALGTFLTVIPRIGVAIAALTGPFGLAALGLAAIGAGIALVVKNHNEAMGVMRRTAALAAADTKDNMLAVAAVQVRAATMGGEALAQWNELAFKFGKDFRQIFNELQTNPAYGTLKKILDDAKAGLAAAATAGERLDQVIIRMGGDANAANVPLKELVRIVETALPPARDLSWALESWSIQLVEGVLPAARQLPDAIRDYLITPISEASLIGESLFSSMKEGFAAIAEGSKTMGQAFHSVVGQMLGDIARLVFAQLAGSLKIILAKQMESIAHFIASAFKHLGIFAIPVAAGAFALVSGLFKKLLKFEEGGVFKEPTIAEVGHGTEYVLPEKKLIRLVQDALGVGRGMPSPQLAFAAASPVGTMGSPRIYLTMNVRSLDRTTVEEAGRLIFDEMDNQLRKRGLRRT